MMIAQLLLRTLRFSVILVAIPLLIVLLSRASAYDPDLIRSPTKRDNAMQAVYNKTLGVSTILVLTF
jgi:hypothetical protein